MVVEMHNGGVPRRPAEDLADFAKARKMLLNDVPFVEGRRHILALNDSAVGGRHPAEAVRAVATCAGSQWSLGFSHRFLGVCRI